jgi:hypothetical protein
MRYIVEGPDGKRYIVEGPAQAAPTQPPAQPVNAAPEASPLGSDGQNFAAGMGRAVAATGRGLKQLIDPAAVWLERTLDPNKRLAAATGTPSAEQGAAETAASVEEARRLDAPLMDTKAGIGGNVLGNLMLTAVPGAKLQGALQATRAGRLAQAAAAAGSGAGIEFATAEGSLEDKTKSALFAGALSGGMTGALATAAKPFKAKADAVTLINKGVVPTLQQGADTPVGRFIGGLTAGSSLVKSRQERELQNALLKKITEGAVEAADDTGKNTLAAARHYVSGEYDKILANKSFTLSGTRLSKARQAAQQLNARGQMADEAKEAGRTVSNILGPAQLNSTPTQISSAELTDLTNKLSTAAYESGSAEVRNRILAARNVLIERVRNTKLSADELERIGVLDSKHFDVKRLEEATKGIRGELEGLSIPAVTNAYAKKNMASNSTLEDLIAPAARILGPSHAANESRSQLVSAMRVSAPLAGAGAATAYGVPGVAPGLAGLYGLSAVGQTAKGAKMLFGETNKQKLLADLVRRGYGAGLAPAVLED